MKLSTRISCGFLSAGLALALAACGSDAGTTTSTTSKTDASSDSSSGTDAKGGDTTSGDTTSADTTGADTTGADTAGGDTTSADTATGPTKWCGKYADEAAAVAGDDKLTPPQGLFLAAQAAPFGGLQLFFKASIVGHQTADGGGVMKLITLRAVSGKTKEVTDIMAAACDVVVKADGSFTIDFGDVVLPAKGSPTDTDVKLSLIMTGKFTGLNSFCGDLEGNVPDFGVKLTGSKFKAVEFGTQTDPPESSCEGNTAKTYTGIATCPALLPGENTMTSAERSRTYIVQLPKDVSDVTGLPVIFLYHGVGGEPGSMIDDSFLTAEQQKTPFILIAPRSERAASGKAVLKTDWYYGSPLFKNDNPDLVFFDDLLKCAGAQYKFDTKRIYVTGMSGGGLMSTFLGIHKSDVVAAATPFSGGYLHAWPTKSGNVPFVVSWGGVDDFAYEQNFDKMAKSLIESLKGSGHVVVACNHGTKHEWPKEGGAYAAKFLLAHKLGEASPFVSSLGDSWPSYCSLQK